MTNEAAKNASISLKLLSAIAEKAEEMGVEVNSHEALRAGWDSFFGEGAFSQFASDLYDDLRAKAA